MARQMTEEEIIQKKADDLVRWFEIDSVTAESYVKKTIDDLFITLQSVLQDTAPVMSKVQELRGDKMAALNKIKIARKVDKDMKEIQEKYSGLFAQMQKQKPDIIAALSFTVKDEYRDSMSKVIGIVLFTINNLTGGR